MGKIMRILINLILIGLFFIGIINPVAMAAEPDYSSGSDLLQTMQNDISSFLTTGASEAEKDGIKPGEMAKNFKGLGQILTMVGVGVLIGVTSFMGIKYLTAGPEAQAKLKIQLIGIVVSGFVIFGGFYIWKLVVTLASGLQGA